MEFYNSAKSQWSGAGISTYNSNTASTSTINWYAGKKGDLEALDPALKNYQAYTHTTEVAAGTHYYNGIPKYNKRLSKSRIYTPYYWYNTDSADKIMFTHEMGHAIGWLGYSGSTSDLMHSSGGSSTLTTRDKNHIKLNY